MHTRLTLLFLCLICATLIAACGGSPPGDPANGRKLFRGEVAMSRNGQKCVGCHADTTTGESPLGPNLSNIGSRAGVTVKEQSAEDYLRASILRPDDYLAGGFQEGIMPRTYPQALTDQQVSDLVAYMETLKSGQN